MSSAYRLRLTDAGKRFTKYTDTPMLINSLSFRQRTKREALWAVRHLDVDIAPGETVGLIGRNGSGKSTTLQMLAGVTSPTEGRVSVRGRVAPLISVGVGFHPELTGRENVYVNGTILGMTRREIDARLDAIIDFAEIESFMDTPVKFYSSGMVVRLGFAVAVQAQPDVLLVDEVLAVGDLAFQVKCYDRMNEIKRQGTTIVVVSHNLHAIKMMCERTLLLHEGRLEFDGDTGRALSLFHERMRPSNDPAGAPSSAATIVEARLIDDEGESSAEVHSGDPLTVELDIRFGRDVEQPAVGVMVESETGGLVFNDSTYDKPIGRCPAGTRLRLRAQLRAALVAGTYTVTASVVELADRAGTVGEPEILCVSTPMAFFVSNPGTATGTADLDASFTWDLS